MGNEPLAACPFCGGAATVMHVRPGDVYAICTECSASHVRTEAGRAIAAWNRRAPSTVEANRKLAGNSPTPTQLEAAAEAALEVWLDIRDHNDAMDDFSAKDPWPAVVRAVLEAVGRG